MIESNFIMIAPVLPSSNIKSVTSIYLELLEAGIVSKGKLQVKRPWNTNEFGFYDLNKNAIFFVEDILSNKN